MFKIVLRNSLKLSNSMQGPSLLSKTFKGTDDDMPVVYTVHFIYFNFIVRHHGRASVKALSMDFIIFYFLPESIPWAESYQHDHKTRTFV